EPDALGEAGEVAQEVGELFCERGEGLPRDVDDEAILHSLHLIVGFGLGDKRGIAEGLPGVSAVEEDAVLVYDVHRTRTDHAELVVDLAVADENLAFAGVADLSSRGEGIQGGCGKPGEGLVGCEEAADLLDFDADWRIHGLNLPIRL